MKVHVRPDRRQIETMAAVVSGVAGMQEKMQSMHKEILELISALSDDAASQQSSLVCGFSPTK